MADDRQDILPLGQRSNQNVPMLSMGAYSAIPSLPNPSAAAQFCTSSWKAKVAEVSIDRIARTVMSITPCTFIALLRRLFPPARIHWPEWRNVRRKICRQSTNDLTNLQRAWIWERCGRWMVIRRWRSGIVTSGRFRPLKMNRFWCWTVCTRAFPAVDSYVSASQENAFPCSHCSENFS